MCGLWCHMSQDRKLDPTDTIFALSSAPGRAGVAVFRVSGPGAARVVERVAGTLPSPRRASLRRLRGEAGTLDRALVLWMPGPGTFTGEDVAEIMPHGSRAVTEALAGALLAAGARQARPGEFVRRAFANGKMDLLEAEGLADLIDSETEAQRVQALRQMEGGLSARAGGWKTALLDALAPIEGEIDFPDEQDVPDRLSREAGPILDALREELDRTLGEFGRGERVREGLRVAVIGAPNSGKSSFINSLAGRDVAIVTDIPGTTRDVVEVQLDLCGLPVRVADTAGLREAADQVEREGVRRARDAAQDADLRVLMVDAADPKPDGVEALMPGDVLVVNKSDVVSDCPALPFAWDDEPLMVSVRDGSGVSELVATLEREVVARFAPTRDPGLTRARHRDCVQRARDAIVCARAQLDAAPELAADELRQALRALDELAGRADMDAVLDRVFSRFCIGK